MATLAIAENGNTEAFSAINNNRSALKKYDFVLNNYTKNDMATLATEFQRICTRYIWGEEIGEQGTPHLQGGIWLRKKTRITELKHICNGRLSFRKIRNEKALFDYCQKDQTNIIKFGNFNDLEDDEIYTGQDLPTILYPWQDTVLKILKEVPDDRTIHWIYDNIGNTGKSKFTKFMEFHYNATGITKGKYSDIMNFLYNIKKLKILLVDLARNTDGNVSFNALEDAKSGSIFNTKYETGKKLILSPHVLVMSNSLPNLTKLSIDRWKIWGINEQKELFNIDINDENYFPKDRRERWKIQRSLLEEIDY